MALFSSRSALASIEEVGRTALDDLDHVLGLLRDESSATSPQPTLRQLEQLLGDSRAAGVIIDGERSGTIVSLPPVVSREAYRIVQEGLTNALRHAGPVPVRLRLHVDADRLELEMTNPLGTGEHTRRSADGAGPRGGRGLQGIRERVTVLHGCLLYTSPSPRDRTRSRMPSSA